MKVCCWLGLEGEAKNLCILKLILFAVITGTESHLITGGWSCGLCFVFLPSMRAFMRLRVLQWSRRMSMLELTSLPELSTSAGLLSTLQRIYSLRFTQPFSVSIVIHPRYIVVHSDWCNIHGSMYYIDRVMTNFVIKFPNVCCHGNRGSLE